VDIVFFVAVFGFEHKGPWAGQAIHPPKFKINQANTNTNTNTNA